MINNNDEIVIRALSNAQAVRTRPGMYIGTTDNPNLILAECYENNMDESFSCKTCNNIVIYTDFYGYCLTADNGRGLPITFSVDDPTKTQAFLAVAKLHAGGKFQTTGITTGLHGVGVSCCNFLSSRFVCMSKITEDNWDKSIPPVRALWESQGPRSKKDLFYYLVFEEGELKFEGAGRKCDIEKSFGFDKDSIPSGLSTITFFAPDPKIFSSIKAEVSLQVLQNFLIIQDKFYKRKVSVWLDGTELTIKGFNPYRYEIIKSITPKDPTLNPELGIYITFEVDKDLGPKQDGGSVNGLKVDSGVHLKYVEAVYEEALKSEYKIKHKYTMNGLKMYVILLATEVSYSSQTKTNLVSISKVKITDFAELAKDFIKIFRKDPDYWGFHVEKLNILANSMKSLSAMDRAQQMIDQSSGNAFYRNKSNLVDGFSDATIPNRWDAELFLCEGLSPAGSLKSGRKVIPGQGLKEAVLPLKGKILNVSNVDIDKALDNKEISTIFTLLGVGIDGNNVTSNCKTPEEAYQALQKYCRYGKVVIATDADSDGSQIASLILYLFSKYARFLIDFGMVYIAVSPLFMQGNKFYFPNDPIDPSTGFPVGLDLKKPYERYKGLGSIDKDLIYDSYYNPATRRLIQVTPDGIDYSMRLTEDIEERKKLLFGAGIISNPYGFTDL